MKPFPGALVTGTLIFALAPLSASARNVHHRHHHYARSHHATYRSNAYAGQAGSAYGGYGSGPHNLPSDEPLGSGEYNPYVGYQGPGSVVLNATERARREPGLATELAPDAKETATGGPVGGLPGHEGP